MQSGPDVKSESSDESAAESEAEKTLSYERKLEIHRRSFREFLDGRLEDVEKCIADLGIRNNLPHCSPPMPPSIITHEDQKLFAVRVALLPILLEAIRGDAKCQRVYEQLRPIAGSAIDSSIRNAIASISLDDTYQISLVNKQGPLTEPFKMKLGQEKASKALIQKSAFGKLEVLLARSIEVLGDFVIDSLTGIATDSNPAEFAEKVVTGILDHDSFVVGSITARFPVGALYPQILCQAVIEDISLYTTLRSKESLRELFLVPHDLDSIRTVADNLLMKTRENFKSQSIIDYEICRLDSYRDEQGERIPVIIHDDRWSFLKNPRLASFLKAVEKADVYCWKNSLSDGTRKLGLDRFLKRFDLDSMMDYLEGEAEKQSLAAASAPKPKEGKSTQVAESTSVDPALELRVKVPESISARLKQIFPQQKASEVLKVGRRIVEDGLRYNASESDLLELIGKFKGLSLKDLGYRIHSVLGEQSLGGVVPNSAEPKPIEKKEDGMKLSEALEKSVILLLKNAPDFKAGQHSITEELSKVPGSQPEEEISRYLNEGLLIPTGEGDELMLNPAYWD